MRKISALFLIMLLIFSLSIPAWAADSIASDPTGYTCADDVEYVIVSGSVVNWGARGEDAAFLTTYAEDYYGGDYSWDTLSQLSGGSGTSDAYSSQLYEALQDMMTTCHTSKTSYGDTRYLFCYTDCERNDYSTISSFYSGKALSGAWDQGNTWNREHTWPRSKTAYSKPKNSTVNETTDIMSLRPTATSENGNRGNTAFGESSGYFDPGADVRGDCARIALYVYVRWGNTQYMWGSAGVIESLDVLLRWMEEDPVDTWEMGRNDAVQSITGVRNVFVDYPEYAWLLFGTEIPEGLVTPSGKAAEGDACTHENAELRNVLEATCTNNGYTGDTLCLDCGCFVAIGEVLPATGEHTLDEVRCCIYCDYYETAYTECDHANVEHRNQKDATCGSDGHTGDVYCADCGQFIAGGSVIPATGHQFSQWITAPGGGSQSRWCSVCNYEETEPSTAPSPAPAPNWPAIAIVAAVVIVLAGGVIASVIIKKKRT